MSRRAVFARVILAAAAASLAGCSSCSHGSDSSPSVVDAAPPVAEAPVPAPDGLAIEAYLATPDALWTRLQRGVGGPAAILPATFAGLLLAVAGADPTLAFEVDGAAPAFGVVAERAGAKEREAVPAGAPPSWAVAMRLRSARHTEDTLLGADGGHYTAKDIAPGLRALASTGVAPLSLAVGIARSGWLIVAANEADLARLGPYAYRSLPAKPAPDGAPFVAVASHDALAGTIRVRLASLWNDEKSDLLTSAERLQEAHDGGAPDFADPPAILGALDAAVQRRLSLLGDLAEARLTLDVAEDDVHLEVLAPPAGGGGPASQALAALAPGDAKPLLAVPGDALVALMMRDVPGERGADADDIASALERAFGGRLSPDEAKRLHEGMGGWAKARGDWLTAWLSTRGPIGVAARAPLSPAPDASALAARSVRELVELQARPAFLEPLRAAFHVKEPSFATADVPGGGKATLATFARVAPPGGVKPGALAALSAVPLGFAWVAEGGEIDVAAGQADAVVAALGAARKPPSTLGDDPATARLLGGLDSNATFALVAQPARAGGATESSPFVLAWGRKASSAWARLDVFPTLFRELLRMLAGL